MMKSSLTRRRFCLSALACLAAPDIARAAICMTSASGNTCLSQPAQRIITLDSRHTENLLATGIQPVGAAATADYRRIMNGVEPALSAGVVDVGLASTPALDVMLSLHPDLILGNARNTQKTLPLLQSICPVIAFDAYPAQPGNHYDLMATTFLNVADVTAQRQRATQFLAQLDNLLAQSRTQLAAAGWQNKTVVLGTINTGITGADIMLFNANSLPATILQRLGLRYAVNDTRYQQLGFHVTSVEALVPLQDAHFLYMPFNPDGVKNVMNAPIWRKLHFVQQGLVTALPYHEMYAGPLTARQFIQDIVRVLLA